MQRYRVDDLPVMPWKNGGGTTREVAAWPPGAGLDAFLWRVSIAEIAAGGPFSAFPGIDRVIALLRGDGVRLRSRDGAVDHALDTALAPFAFPGEAAIDCALLGGASSDFNVMTRRGELAARVEVLADARAYAPAPHGVLLAARGGWTVAAEGEPAFALAPGEGCWWAGRPLGLELAPAAPGAALLAVRMAPPAEEER